MTEDTLHLDPFAAAAPRLRSLAYRMLGSYSDAEDVVQDAWLRWSATAAEDIRVPEAFLTTMVGRIALDRLRAARRAREAYFGAWLPEPVAPAADDAELPGDASVGFLVLLERLTPEQRAVYVLREAMELDYARIAEILAKTEAGCRQLMRRAKDALGGAARAAVDLATARRVADAFARFSLARDYAQIVALMADDAVLTADGGGMAKSAINPIYGPDRIARFFIGVQNKLKGALDFRSAVINGRPALVTTRDGALHGAMSFEIVDGRIANLYWVVNPQKLGHVAA
jgi:RNA polymerase sigma-70 factor, ECF subfamily